MELQSQMQKETHAERQINKIMLKQKDRQRDRYRGIETETYLKINLQKEMELESQKQRMRKKGMKTRRKRPMRKDSHKQKFDEGQKNRIIDSDRPSQIETKWRKKK